MLIPSAEIGGGGTFASLSRRVNANSQPYQAFEDGSGKLIKKGEC